MNEVLGRDRRDPTDPGRVEITVDFPFRLPGGGSDTETVTAVVERCWRNLPTFPART